MCCAEQSGESYIIFAIDLRSKDGTVGKCAAFMQEVPSSILGSHILVLASFRSVFLKVPQTPKIGFAKINFRYCPVNYGEKAFGPGFFFQMLYLLKARKLGAFFGPWTTIQERMGLVYFVMPSQCFIRPRNKHKQRER